MNDLEREILKAEEELKILNERRKELVKKILSLKQQMDSATKPTVPDSESNIVINNYSSEKIKIDLFRSLFKGREDVFPKRFENLKTGKSGYQPVCNNEWIPGICEKPGVKCSECKKQAFIPVNDIIIRNHLTGLDPASRSKPNFVIGVYPLLTDDTCFFLAVDFDKSEWQKDASAFLDVCRQKNIPAALERSRSGNGGHAWIFFSEPVAASTARKLGSHIITTAMKQRPEINFDSYDRFFPSQDTLPKGGFGNLIALPLQKKARENGNSVFIDDQLIPYKDQWNYLASVQRLSKYEAEDIVRKAVSSRMILGVKQAIDDECEEPWDILNRKKMDISFKTGELPAIINLVLANQIFIQKKDLPPKLINLLIHLAAFQNPEFYKAQVMRLPVYNKPRIISCHEEYPDHIGLPRGCLEDIKRLLNSILVKTQIVDKRNSGKIIDADFSGELKPEQEEAVKAILGFDMGILAASTAFGKTVAAINIIAQRKVNTLILVHRKQLMEQWLNRLRSFLKIDSESIGFLGGGKRKLSGIIDVALIQSLNKKNEVDSIVTEYGQVIVDECHHISAYSFEMVLKNIAAKYILGLSATVARKDGHHPIIFMRCGPVRFSDDPKKQAEQRPFEHLVIPRFTGFKISADTNEKELTIQNQYAAIIEDEMRNHLIAEDVIQNYKKGRNSLILTERLAHIKILKELISEWIPDVHTLTGDNSSALTTDIIKEISLTPVNKQLTIISTGRYIGEGFDEPRLDTLFLVMPVSWRGTLAQYVGRLHRLHENKCEVQVYDYIDIHVKTFERMYIKRLAGYASFGYKISGDSSIPGTSNFIFDRNSFLPVYNNDIDHAGKEILIVCPYLSKRRTIQTVKPLQALINNSVVVKIVIRPIDDYKEKDRSNISDSINIINDAGIQILFKSGIHQKFAIIDQKIVWYGSINLLSYGNSEESMMRIESSNIAYELINSIDILSR